MIDSFILAVEEYGAPEVDEQVRVLHQQRGLVVLGQVGEAVQVVRDPRDPLHGEAVAGDGGAGADRDPEHGAHDHLLDQLLSEVDRPVLVVVSLHQTLQMKGLVVRELDLRLVVVQGVH